MSQERTSSELASPGEISLPSLQPMLPTEAMILPSDIDKWLVEIKLDGLRAQALLSPKGVAILTRSGRNVASSFPDITASLAVRGRRHTAILDGELIFDEGKTAQDRSKVAGRAGASRRTIGPEGPFKFAVFDILFMDGRRLTELPLIERKKQLKRLLSANFRKNHPQITLVPFAKGSQRPKLITDAQTQGFEGVVLKAQDSLYRAGTHNSWLKLKFTRETSS